jgi:hypothetical protein
MVYPEYLGYYFLSALGVDITVTLTTGCMQTYKKSKTIDDNTKNIN